MVDYTNYNTFDGFIRFIGIIYKINICLFYPQRCQEADIHRVKHLQIHHHGIKLIYWREGDKRCGYYPGKSDSICFPKAWKDAVAKGKSELGKSNLMVLIFGPGQKVSGNDCEHTCKDREARFTNLGMSYYQQYIDCGKLKMDDGTQRCVCGSQG